MSSRHEAFLVAKIDRDTERRAGRDRIAKEAEAVIAAFVARFTRDDERAIAADALVRAVAAAATGVGGSSCAVRRFAGSAGRAEVLPSARFHGRGF